MIRGSDPSAWMREWTSRPDLVDTAVEVDQLRQSQDSICQQRQFKPAYALTKQYPTHGMIVLK